MTALGSRDPQADEPARQHPSPHGGDAPDGTGQYRSPQPRTLRLVGLGGTLLITLGSFGSGAMPVYDPVSRTPVLRELREGSGPQVALGMVYAGLVILGLAWLYLGRSVRRGDPGTTTGDLLRTTALWAAPLLVATPLFSRDMYSYAAQAQLTHHGIDPYANGPAALPGPFLDEVQRMWVDTPAPYGPLWLWLASLVASVIGAHVLLTVASMRLLAVLGVVLIACYLPRLARHCGVDPRMGLWLAVLNPLLLIHFVAGGHNDALMLGLMLAGVVLAAEASTERRVALGVVVTTLAVAIKAPAALGVVFLAPIWARHLHGRYTWLKATGKVAAVSLATFGAVTLVTGLGIGWVRQLDTPGAVVNWASASTGLGMLVNEFREWFGLGGDDRAIVEAFRRVGQVVAAVTVAVLWVRSFSRRPVRALGAALAVVIILGPVVQPWYLVWAFVFAAAAPLSDRIRMAAAGVTLFLAMLITPQGAGLFLETRPVFATGIAALVTTYVVLRRDHDTDPGGIRPTRQEA